MVPPDANQRDLGVPPLVQRLPAGPVSTISLARAGPVPETAARLRRARGRGGHGDSEDTLLNGAAFGSTAEEYAVSRRRHPRCGQVIRQRPLRRYGPRSPSHEAVGMRRRPYEVRGRPYGTGTDLDIVPGMAPRAAPEPDCPARPQGSPFRKWQPSCNWAGRAVIVGPRRSTSDMTSSYTEPTRRSSRAGPALQSR